MRVDPFTEAELTRNAFLGGQLHIWQPRDGYRAGVDPVLLAASLPAKPGQNILELGCGGGIGLACLGWRVPDLHLTGIELQPGYADLARRNLDGQDATIHTGDLHQMPDALRQQSFDHVFANPPYFAPGHRSEAAASDREQALAGTDPAAWVTVAARRLKPGGSATFIQRSERLPEMLSALHQSLGSLELWPLAPRDGHPPRLVLLRGRKSGRAAFRLHAPLTLHAGTTHRDDAKDYTPAVQAVLAQGAALPFPT